MALALPCKLATWLDAVADDMDTTRDLAHDIVPQLATAGLFGAGVPASFGGSGGTTVDAIAAIAAVAEHSVTAAFVFWGQRTFIEYLLQSPNAALRERWIKPLVAGEHAGATGLSNAMKFLSGIESLQIDARAHEGGWRLLGSLAWITNLRPQGYVAAAAVNMPDGAPPAVIAFSGERTGVVRSPDLDLLGLRSSNTAAVKLTAVQISPDDILHPNAPAWLPTVRPAFLGMQCGLSIGLARASLRAAHAQSAGMRGLLLERVEALQAELAAATAELEAGVLDRRFESAAAPMFKLRIALADIVQRAVMLELQASGGKSYLRGSDGGFARRLRESAFIPIVTPSLTQLQVALDQHARA